MNENEIVTPHLIRMIAVDAECDPRTVQRALAGRPIRKSALVRIMRSIRTRKLDGLLANINVAVAR
jgi:hypothetical protein